MTGPVYDFACADCGADTLELDEGYMVHDHVWPIDPAGGMLCVGCLERRIGRRLEFGDFTTAPLNWAFGYRHSDRLAARLPPPPPCDVCGGPGVNTVPRYGRARNVVVCGRHLRLWAESLLDEGAPGVTIAGDLLELLVAAIEQAEPEQRARLRAALELDRSVSTAHTPLERAAYTPQTLAAELGRTPRAIRAAIQRGELEAVKRGRGWLIPAGAVERWTATEGARRPRAAPARRAPRRSPGRGPMGRALER